MNMRFTIALMALLTVVPIFPPTLAFAQSAPTSDSSPLTIQPTPQAADSCKIPTTQRLDLAQGPQTDCCKGHKGVCGCRAGKIVCCDNTVSPNCTCHSDWGVAD
jgi:hypothetical protein